MQIQNIASAVAFGKQQKTLVLLKPDTVEDKHVGEVIDKFEKQGYDINAMKMFKMPGLLADMHYSHITKKPFYPDIREYMTRSPIIAMVWSGDNVIEGVRKLIGATNPENAEHGTIRAKYGKVENLPNGSSKQENCVHASDSEEAADHEISLYFNKFELMA